MPEQKRPTRLFKGPLLLPSKRSLPARQLSDVPVARGVVDEGDFERSMLSRAYLRRRGKEGKDEAERPVDKP